MSLREKRDRGVQGRRGERRRKGEGGERERERGGEGGRGRKERERERERERVAAAAVIMTDLAGFCWSLPNENFVVFLKVG